MSVKESNINEKKSKFSHLLTVRAEVADPPPPLYGQPNHKISVFLPTPLASCQIVGKFRLSIKLLLSMILSKIILFDTFHFGTEL